MVAVSRPFLAAAAGEARSASAANIVVMVISLFRGRLPWQPPRQLARLDGNLLVLGIARRSEHLLHFVVSQAFDEPRLDEGSVAAALHDLAKHPVQVLTRK